VTTRDGESFERFFRAVRPALTGPAWLMTGDLAEAHDLVQETLCRAWSNWDRVQAYEQPEAWARRVLANLIIGRWRRRRRESRLGAAEVPDTATLPQIELVAALNMLPKAQRQAIVLHDFVGLKVSEIAAEVGVPAGTVKSWLSPGRAGSSFGSPLANGAARRLPDRLESDSRRPSSAIRESRSETVCVRRSTAWRS